jgi:hypothetical protein
MTSPEVRGASDARARPLRSEHRWELLHLAILSALALAHPVLEVLGASPAYFIALRAGPLEASILLAAALSVPLAAMALLLRVAGRLSESFRHSVHLTLVGLLAAGLLVPPFHRLGLAHPQLLALPAGILAALAYRRARPVRELVTFLGLGLVAVPFAFVTSLAGEDLFRGAGFLRSPQDVVARPARVISRPLPVVILLFDEFPLGVLLDAGGGINRARYPGFAELATLSTWYRDATSAAEVTDVSISAMMTGRRIREAGAPTYTRYPDNLFALLSGRYRVRATEFWTRLGPPVEGATAAGPSRRASTIWTMLRDSGALALRIVATPAHAEAVVTGGAGPELPRPWRRGFDEAPLRFQEFLSGLASDEPPTIHFLHVMAPHSPYQRLPSTQRYTADLTSLGESTERPDADQAARLLQRAALQVGVADGMVAQLLARLRETGLIDRAVVVVAADHGIAFQAGALHRATTPGTLEEIAPVPLFVRAPGERAGTVVDAPIELIDLLPTLADLLGAELPWPVDGRIAKEIDPVEPRRRAITTETGKVVEFDDRQLARRAARRYASIIGAGGWEELWRIGPLPGLVFHELSALPVGGTSGVKVRWRADADVGSADPASELLPALLTVELVPATAGNLVVALNGRVGATTAFGAGPLRPNRILLPPSLFTKGKNRLQFLIQEPSAPWRFQLAREEEARPD